MKKIHFRKPFYLILFCFVSVSVFGQATPPAPNNPKPLEKDKKDAVQPQQIDSQKDQDSQTERPPREDLPFPINEKKRLTVRDVNKKQEGGFFTGLPLINSDPNNGIGYGIRVFYFQNGEKKNPLFEYTPYRYRVFAQYFQTTRNAEFHTINFDAPYIFDSQWRLRADMIMERNPNNLYFGVGESSLKTLSYKDYQAYGTPIVENATFASYEEGQRFRRLGNDPTQQGMVTQHLYNRYDFQNPNANFSFERSFFGGTVRAVMGTRISRQTIRTYDNTFTNAPGPFFATDGNNLAVNQFFGNAIFSEIPTQVPQTKLVEDSKAGLIRGLNGGYVNTLRVGLVYDTRDFEPDPNSGVFLETTHERSSKAFGSNYQFNRTLASARVFYSPFKGTVEKLVFAGRATFSNTTGDAPFYEYRNMWGTEGQVAGLGGRTTLRGYKQDRFIGPAMGFANLELRWKFWGIKTAKGSTFDFQVVPFFDIGRVWDRASDANFKDYKFSQGIGLRIPWNQSTIIYVDHAWSREDRQTFFNFQHIF